jgi:lipid-A-disaccharide synthase-like uncharacterized protein
MDPGDSSNFWLAVGLAGNATFGVRFLVQWVASERAGRSVVPVAFWYISIVGSLIFLAFSLNLGATAGWKKAAPIILGYSVNLVPYVRNLMLIRKERSRAGEGAADRTGSMGPGAPQDLEAARR